MQVFYGVLELAITNCFGLPEQRTILKSLEISEKK